MDTDSQAKQTNQPTVSVQIQTLGRITTALEKCNQLMERHLAAGEKTVPARALYFILRDAGFGTSPARKQQIEPPKQEIQQTQKRIEQPTNQLHHNYGMRR